MNDEEGKESGYKPGDMVRLISFHSDRRPTTIRNAGPTSCVLDEPRQGYLTWNNGDIERCDKPETDPAEAGHPALPAKMYLGDSVYAEYDDRGIVLTTDNGCGPSNTICLDRNVLSALDIFRKRVEEALR